MTTLTPAELVRRAHPLVSDLGGRYYFAPVSLHRAAALGLSPSQWYFLGRGGALGDVDAAVADSALGYFAPLVVRRYWDSGRSVVPPQAAAAAHIECCRNFGRQHLDGAPFLVSFVPAAAKVLAEASSLALPLFAGVKTFALAEDLPGAATQAVTAIREFGGGVHLLAIAAAGLEPRKAHWLTRPDAWESFGYQAADAPNVTDQDTQRLAHADELTRTLLEPAYAALDEQEAEAVLNGLTEMTSLLPTPELPE
jgi:hypothetical protein